MARPLTRMGAGVPPSQWAVSTDVAGSLHSTSRELAAVWSSYKTKQETTNFKSYLFRLGNGEGGWLFDTHRDDSVINVE